MNPHGVQVLDGTDDHHVIGGVPHHLQLVLLPADNRFLHQDLVGGRGVNPRHDHLLVLFPVVGDPPPGSPQGVGRTDNGREPHHFHYLHRLLEVVGEPGGGDSQADLLHGSLEEGPVLGLLDGRELGADELHTIFFQDPSLRHRHRHVEGGLPPQGGKEGVGALLFDDFLQILRGHRLDVGPVGEVRVGHDGGGVAVQEHHLVPFLFQRLASLGAGVVELARLADDDGAGADDDDLLDVGTFGHMKTTPSG